MLALDLSFLEKSLAEAGVLAKGDCSVSPRVSSVTGVILGPLAITVPRKQAFTLRPMHQWQWGGGGGEAASPAHGVSPPSSKT